MSFDQTTYEFSVQTNKQSDEGEYPIDVVTYLTGYPDVKTEVTFMVNIRFCAVTDILTTPVDPQIYNVYTP